MGMVWRAWDERLMRQVAVKHIRTDAQHDKLRERFWREAQTAARLNHPSIVHIYDLVESPDGDWIVMELVEGKTIRSLIQEAGRLPFVQAVELALDIAEGLAEAHSLGVLHRDLKAANVMVTPSGRAKILDFGLAKQLPRADGDEDQEASLSTTGLVVGTSYAMSPEQVLGSPLDVRSDLFSLGSLIYEMLAQEPPFRAATSAASMASVLSFQPPPLVEKCQEVPQALSNLIGRLLQKDPRFRPQSASEVVKVLAALAGVSAAQDDSQPSTVAEPLVPGLREENRGLSSIDGRRTPRLWRPWGLGFLAVVLTLGAWLWPRFQTARQPSPKPEAYAVRVLVVDPQRRPVDATIRPPTGSVLRRLPDGWWEVAIPAGKVPADGWISIRAEHDDWEANRKDLHLEVDPNPRVVIPLKSPESWLRGEVVDPNNRPVAGARVSRLEGAREEAVTGPKGRFELKLPVPPEKRVRLRTEHEGWAPGDDFCFSGRDTCYIVLNREER
jgi:serine/threonine protein kinase